MEEYLYHVSPAKNTESILRNGLRRKGFAVYMSSKPFSWFRDGMTIFRVRVDGLPGEWSDFLPSDEYLYWGDIEASRVSEYCAGGNKH